MSGVLIEEAPYRIEDFAPYCDLSEEKWMQVFYKLCDQERAWDKVERGELSLTNFSKQLSERIVIAGGQCSENTAATLWGDPDPFTCALSVRNELFILIDNLCKNKKNCLCTNNVREWESAWRKLLPPSTNFDYIFDSSQIGARKPEAEFFAHVENITGAKGQEILFIDDRLENLIHAKNNFGWRIHFFRDTITLKSELSAMKLC